MQIGRRRRRRWSPGNVQGYSLQLTFHHMYPLSLASTTCTGIRTERKPCSSEIGPFNCAVELSDRALYRASYTPFTQVAECPARWTSPSGQLPCRVYSHVPVATMRTFRRIQAIPLLRAFRGHSAQRVRTLQNIVSADLRPCCPLSTLATITSPWCLARNQYEDATDPIHRF